MINKVIEYAGISSHTLLFDFDIIHNNGYITGLLPDHPILIIIMDILLCRLFFFMLFRTAKKRDSVHFLYLLAPWLMAAGFLSNQIDWLKDGMVVDYIKFKIPNNYLYANIEDIMIIAGVLLYTLQSIFRNKVIEHIYSKK